MNDLTVVEASANWDRLKAMVLDSVSSPITKPVYNMSGKRPNGLFFAGDLGKRIFPQPFS